MQGEVVGSSASARAAGSGAAAFAPVPPAASVAGAHSAGHAGRWGQLSRTGPFAHARFDTSRWVPGGVAAAASGGAPAPPVGGDAPAGSGWIVHHMRLHGEARRHLAVSHRHTGRCQRTDRQGRREASRVGRLPRGPRLALHGGRGGSSRCPAGAPNPPGLQSNGSTPQCPAVTQAGDGARTGRAGPGQAASIGAPADPASLSMKGHGGTSQRLPVAPNPPGPQQGPRRAIGSSPTQTAAGPLTGELLPEPSRGRLASLSFGTHCCNTRRAPRSRATAPVGSMPTAAHEAWASSSTSNLGPQPPPAVTWVGTSARGSAAFPGSSLHVSSDPPAWVLPGWRTRSWPRPPSTAAARGESPRPR